MVQKRLQTAVGRLVSDFIRFSFKHPYIWKDENWDATYALVESIANLITIAVGGTDPNPVINNIMEKCGRK